jgi:hypothetical protein
MGIQPCRVGVIVMLTPEDERPEMICCICEKCSAGRIIGNIPIPLCIRCRTRQFERIAAAEPTPITVLSNPTGPDLLIQKGQVLIASGSPGPPLEAA